MATGGEPATEEAVVREEPATAPRAGALPELDTATVPFAFALGWNMAELFHARIPGSTPPSPGLPPTLPGMSELDDLAQARLLLDEITVGIGRVARFEEWGLATPELAPLQRLLKARSRDPDKVRAAVLAVHLRLMSGLTATDFRLGKAYGLGRALAETTLLPSADDQDSLRRAFDRFRVARLQRWMSDLKSLLPPHAAQGVRGSVDVWSTWVQHPTMGLWSERTQREVGERPVDWDSAEDRQRIDRALRRQGQVWRALLSGEKRGQDLLSAQNYVQAGVQLISRLGNLVGGFLRRFWWWGVVGVLVIVLVVALIAIGVASTIAAGLAAAAGAAGISWKAVGGTLGKALARAERPLWEAELDRSIAKAATRLPQEVLPDATMTAAQRMGPM
jgi:hypothetical protein